MNYRQERAQKSRVKQEKQEEKLRRREEASSKRKALREADSAGETPPAGSGTEPAGE
ncbi:MAG TPA: hypothetical protein VHY79_17855 [Rhizomicrobium sp.]|nr:hypothetical protein [Rhizomicrobium sp.]